MILNCYSLVCSLSLYSGREVPIGQSRFRLVSPVNSEFFWLQNFENGKAAIRLQKKLSTSNQDQYNVC